MRYFLIFLISLFLACANQFKSTNLSKIQEIILLQKTACFGNCPEYKITIFNNGDVKYNGIRNVDVIGKRSLSINKKEIRKIISYAKKINFFIMQDEYTEKITDLPTTYIQINNKKVTDYMGAPIQLKNIEDMIEDLIFKKLTN